MDKTLGNTDASGATENVTDIEFFGDGDTMQLICKASSKSEGWMKSTKAMEIAGVGCVVQVTTQQGDQVAEALTFVPGVRIEQTRGPNGGVIARHLAPFSREEARARHRALLEQLEKDDPGAGGIGRPSTGDQ